MDSYDVVIVGAGPAGLSAALILGRCRRRVLICDHGPPRNAASHGLHGFLTRDGIEPSEFLRIGREQLKPYKSVELRQVEVVDAKRNASGFTLTLADDTTISVGLALELTLWTSDLVLCTDGLEGLSTEDTQRLKKHGIRLREERITRLDGLNGMLREIEFSNGEALERDGLFFSTGQYHRSDLARRLGCEFTEEGAVKTGDYETTNIPGLYVAGDASRLVQLAIVAAAEGAQAAFAINQELLKTDLA